LCTSKAGGLFLIFTGQELHAIFKSDEDLQIPVPYFDF
jgi:hypothetical protein